MYPLHLKNVIAFFKCNGYIKMKNKIQYMISFFFSFFPLSLLASQVLLVQDAANLMRAPKAFRTSTQAVNGNFSTEGLDKLYVMGSGQFSENNLKYVLANYPKPSLIIDLRLESHGFLNGIGISWYGNKNWANVGKSNEQVLQIEKQKLDELNHKCQAVVYQIKSKTAGVIREVNPLKIPVEVALDEENLARKYNIRYLRIFVPDHRRPSNQEIERFLTVIHALKPEEWIYIHCRGGKGRTTSFMSMVDMIHNADKVSFEDILIRQHQLGGQNLLRQTLPNSAFASHSTERSSFLRDFYAYCHENKDNFKTSWLEWRTIKQKKNLKNQQDRV